MLRAVVIGLGWWGRHITEAVAKSDRARVVSAFDPAKEASKDFANQHGLSLAASFESILADAAVDGVIVATPHALHEPQALATLAVGKAVFCEKPPAMSAAAGRRIVAAAREKGLVLGIGHERRFEPAMEEVLTILRSGYQAFFDILQGYQGYRTCYYRTFNLGRATPSRHDAYKKALEWLDASIALIKPGVDVVASTWPAATEYRFPDELPLSACNSATARTSAARAADPQPRHQRWRSRSAWCSPYCPATDGFSAARIEEEVVVTDKGCTVITLFPAEELPIANHH